MKGDARSLDYGSCGVMFAQNEQRGHYKELSCLQIRLLVDVLRLGDGR